MGVDIERNLGHHRPTEGYHFKMLALKLHRASGGGTIAFTCNGTTTGTNIDQWSGTITF